MSSARVRTTARRTRRPTSPPTLEITRRLVAHLPSDGGDPDRSVPGDGETVVIPAPCARLIAGYWCSCGGSFRTEYGHEDVTRARVEGADGEWPGYCSSSDGSGRTVVPPTTVHDLAALQRVLEALPIGTVVERHGTGVAPAFDAPALPEWGYSGFEW